MWRIAHTCLTSQLPFREARIEFGDVVASRLKLSKDGTKVLWPQPADDPLDPQNVRLHYPLNVVTMIYDILSSVVRLPEKLAAFYRHTRCDSPGL